MVGKEDAKQQQIASLEADELFGNAIELAAHLRALQEKRRNRKQEIHSQGFKRGSLSQRNIKKNCGAMSYLWWDDRNGQTMGC